MKALNSKRSENQQIKLHANEINKISTDPNVPLKTIMSQWMPLSTAILDTVTDNLPSPLDMPIERIHQIISAKYHASVIGAGFDKSSHKNNNNTDGAGGDDSESDSETDENENNNENNVVICDEDVDNIQMPSSNAKKKLASVDKKRKTALDFQQLPDATKQLAEHFTKNSDKNDTNTPTIAFVSKMIALDLSHEELSKVFEDQKIDHNIKNDEEKRIAAKQRALERSRAYREGTNQSWQENTVTSDELEKNTVNEKEEENTNTTTHVNNQEPKIKMVACGALFKILSLNV